MWSGENVAAVALLPWWSLSDSAPGPRLALLATGLPEAVAQAVSLLGTPTVPPMTRQPFTQLLPDFVVLDVQETLVRGAGGFLAAGFWGSRWDYEPRSSWESSCRVVAKTAVTPHGEL